MMLVQWLEAELAGVDRCVTPWLLVGLHRPMYVPYPHKSNRVVGRHLQARPSYPLIITCILCTKSLGLSGTFHLMSTSMPTAVHCSYAAEIRSL